jgi:TfoX/Sxy family transcriptional regulator of competence genes
MAYDEALANRVRKLMSGESDVTEKKMFGGVALLLGGNMAVVVRGKGGLMIRVGPDQYETVLAEPGAAPAVMRGRPMVGWVTVDPETCTSATDVRRWVKRGVTFARTLPAKA